MKYFIFSVLLILLACLPAFSQDVDRSMPASPMSVLSEEDTIREVVFRKIVTPWMKEFDKNLAAYYQETYYLAIDDDKDPSDALLNRFGGLRRPIRKASESFISEPDGSIVLDKKTKKAGVLFTISKLKWIGKDEVSVTAGSYSGNMGSDSCMYSLKKENGKWEVAGAAQCMVS